MAPLEAQVSHVYKPLLIKLTREGSYMIGELSSPRFVTWCPSHLYKPLTDLWRVTPGGTSLTCL